MTKVFIVAEGVSEIGDLAIEREYRTGIEGYFQPMLRKLLGESTTFEGQKITVFGTKPVSGLRSALAAKAFRARELAAADDAELLIFVMDADRDIERRNYIESGLRHSRQSTPFVVAVPMEMIESWALGDAAALKQLFVTHRKSIPKAPETLWGKKGDSQSDYPKWVLERAMGRKPNREDFAAIAQASSPATLSRTCPKSFAPFERSIREFKKSS